MEHPQLPDWNAPHLTVAADTPVWFDEALAYPMRSAFVTVNDCPIHYLVWDEDPSVAKPGLLLVHGGGAHANWWRFIAPSLAGEFRVAAIDLSGMGDSGRRSEYSAAERALEMKMVIAAAELGPEPFVVGHSFGGYMTMRFGVDFGDAAGGLVIVDSPIRHPDDPMSSTPRRALTQARDYPSFEIAIERFRLMPPQPCEHNFLVEFIARHSLVKSQTGWTWKFDVNALGKSRWEEPFSEHFMNLRCRFGLIYGEDSALVTPPTAKYMASLMPAQAPVVKLEQAQHHVMLDQPQAFVQALKDLLGDWIQAPG